MIDYSNPNDHWLTSDMLKGLSDEERLGVGCLSAIGYVVIFAVALCICALFGSCASSKHLEQNTEQKDSTRVEVKIETVYVTDTLLVEIPAQTAERTTADSVSHLETDYATSDARINTDGSLFHSLANKPQQKPVEFQKPVERKDSIVYRDRFKTQTVTKVKEVERDYSWWDKTRFYASYALFLWLLIKYRRKLFSLARRIFSL